MRVPAILCLAFAIPSPATAQQPERFTLADSEVAIYNLAGAITVEPGSGAVTVLVTRGGADASRLAVEQGEVAGRETLRVVYPDDDILYPGLGRGSSTELRVREDGTFGDDEDHDDRSGRDGRRVRISGSGGGLEAYADLRVQVPTGREVTLHLAAGRVSVANVEGRLRIDAHSAPVSAKGTRGELEVDVGSGQVAVTGAAGTLTLETGSGSIEVAGFAGDELSVDTGSGEVTASEVQAAAVRIETGSGDIRLSSVRAPKVGLETGSGNVSADLLTEPGALNIETGSGNIAVTAPGSLSATVEIETASGDIETDFPVQVMRHSREHLVGQIGGGKGRIAIETGSGNVRLLRRKG